MNIATLSVHAKQTLTARELTKVFIEHYPAEIAGQRFSSLFIINVYLMRTAGEIIRIYNQTGCLVEVSPIAWNK